MGELLGSKDSAEFKELLMTNTVQIDTMYQLLIDKGYFTEAELLEKMKEVSEDYQRHQLKDWPDSEIGRHWHYPAGERP